MAMKLHSLTVPQSRFIWMRKGPVYTQDPKYRYPEPYRSEDYIAGIAGLAERRTIDEFAKHSHFPTEDNQLDGMGGRLKRKKDSTK